VPHFCPVLAEVGILVLRLSFHLGHAWGSGAPPGRGSLPFRIPGVGNAGLLSVVAPRLAGVHSGRIGGTDLISHSMWFLTSN